MKKELAASKGWVRYVLPALLFYTVFMAYPLIDSIRISFFAGPSYDRSFVGLGNYYRLFFDAAVSKRYFGAMKNTMIFFIIHMCVQNVLGILFAVTLTQRNFKSKHIYQTIMFIPTTFAVLVTGYLWKLMLNPLWSKPVLSQLNLGFLAQPWLGNEKTALVAISLVSCWQWVGMPTMMFVAALNNVSEDLYEAADIDGASAIDVFFKIKVPLIMPIIGIISIMTFVSNFNAFDVVFAMENANGAPNYATDLLGTFFYRTGIAGEHPIGIPDPGLGATVATVTFILLLLVSLWSLNATRTRE